MPEVTVYNQQGSAGKAVALREDVFGGEPNEALLHQAVVRQLADQRQGTHDSLTRAEVSRTTKKVWRQKGTGRARQGSRKGPHWSGGGVAFGPHPRSHRLELPKKMRAAAIRSALASKASAGELILLDELRFEAPSTKNMNGLLHTILGGEKGLGSVLIMLDGPQPAVQLSVRNLPNVTAATTANINVLDLLRHKRVLMTVTAARQLETRYGKLNGDESGTVAPEAPAVKKPRATTAVTTKAAATKAAADEAPAAEDAAPAKPARRSARAAKSTADGDAAEGAEAAKGKASAEGGQE